MKILAAEDNPVSSRMLETTLTRWGYKVISVNNGKLALEMMLDTGAPKLAILDWVMPGMEGPEVCKTLREQKTNTPPYLILLTSNNDKKDVAKGLDSGADDYILKPFDRHELKARINVGIRMIKLQKALAETEKFQGVIETSGAVCHELNQPLQIISGNCELLMMDIKDENPFYQRIKTIHEQVKKMAGITSKLMKITKYETKPYLQGRIIDLNKASKTDLQ